MSIANRLAVSKLKIVDIVILLVITLFSAALGWQLSNSAKVVQSTEEITVGEVDLTTREYSEAQKVLIQDMTASTTTNDIEIVFASRNGSRYYPVGCKSGNSIKEENKVFFDNAASALVAGYTLALNCK